VYNEGALNSFSLRGGKDLLRIHARGYQAITLYRDPLTGKRGAIPVNPDPFNGAIPAGTRTNRSLALEAIRKAQHLLLL
jgi:hypothetical protein